ncbi:hypothetical protein PR202_gb11587 [Eleusine coracana subsp. coracana]|uniref:Uncharacterized protein n=1 Tax=Eleusine coracana subsp. coracana TaxID=191504 RepID=A0AAV5ENU0_ELECO|nr:hypothetical protein PR202_gb11587 [Eleusine coracana subsp. coracana]
MQQEGEEEEKVDPDGEDGVSSRGDRRFCTPLVLRLRQRFSPPLPRRFRCGAALTWTSTAFFHGKNSLLQASLMQKLAARAHGPFSIVFAADCCCWGKHE